EGKVIYVGEPVAVVAANTRAVAEDALDLIDIEYESLQDVVCSEETLVANSPIIHDGMANNLAARLVQSSGDVDAAMKQADVVIRERFLLQRGTGQSIEGRAVMVQYDRRTKSFTVWASTQAPHLHQRMLAELFSCSEDKVRVIVPDVGGGFGPKGIFYPEDFLVAYLSYRFSRPVKWVEDRREHFLGSVHEREQVHEVELALRQDGTILAYRDRMIVDMGAYVPWGIIVPSVTLSSLLGPYRIANFYLEANAIYSNKVPI